MSAVGLAETKSDYNRRYDFSALGTWDFKNVRVVSTDPVGKNNLWGQRIRGELEQRLSAAGFQKASGGAPSFLVTYQMGTKQGYETRYIHNGGWGWGPRWNRWGRWYRGWGPGWGGDFTEWRIPYTESTLVLDIIDPRTNELIWRGYDTGSIDFNKADKAIDKSVERLVKRFASEVKKEVKRNAED